MDPDRPTTQVVAEHGHNGQTHQQITHADRVCFQTALQSEGVTVRLAEPPLTAGDPYTPLNSEAPFKSTT